MVGLRMGVQFWFWLGPVTRTQAEVCETGQREAGRGLHYNMM